MVRVKTGCSGVRVPRVQRLLHGLPGGGHQCATPPPGPVLCPLAEGTDSFHCSVAEHEHSTAHGWWGVGGGWMVPLGTSPSGVFLVW